MVIDFNNIDFQIFIVYPISFFLLFYVVNVISYFRNRNNKIGDLNSDIKENPQYKSLLFMSFLIFLFISFTGVIFCIVLFSELEGKSDLISINLKYYFLGLIIFLLLIKNIIFNKFVNFSINNKDKIQVFLAYIIVILSIFELPEIIFLSYILEKLK